MAETKNANRRRAKGDLDATYTVTLSGTYQGTASGVAGEVTTAIKPYRVTVLIDHKNIKEHGALSAFKRFIAPTVMSEKYPDFQSLVTYKVDLCTCDNPDLVADNIHLLGMDGLKEYIESNGLTYDREGYGIDVNLYDDPDKLRQAIVDCETDSEGYKVTQDILRTRYGEVFNSKSDLLRLNAKRIPNPGEDDELPDHTGGKLDATGNPKSKEETIAEQNKETAAQKKAREKAELEAELAKQEAEAEKTAAEKTAAQKKADEDAAKKSAENKKADI